MRYSLNILIPLILPDLHILIIPVIIKEEEAVLIKVAIIKIRVPEITTEAEDINNPLWGRESPLNSGRSGPLVQYFLQLIFQFIPPEALCNDLTRWIDQEIKRYPVEFKGFYGLAVPEFKVADMCPVQFISMDSFLPGSFFLVEGYSKDGEVPVFEFIVSFYHVGVFGPAWTAPAGPEINQQEFAFEGG